MNILCKCHSLRMVHKISERQLRKCWYAECTILYQKHRKAKITQTILRYCKGQCLSKKEYINQSSLVLTVTHSLPCLRFSSSNWGKIWRKLKKQLFYHQSSVLYSYIWFQLAALLSGRRKENWSEARKINNNHSQTDQRCKLGHLKFIHRVRQQRNCLFTTNNTFCDQTEFWITNWPEMQTGTIQVYTPSVPATALLVHHQ